MIKMWPQKFSIYITKQILKNFFVIFFGLFLLFFAVDFFETSNDLKNTKDAIKICTEVVLFRIPALLETIIHFVLLLSSLFAFYRLSNNSEIVVIRSTGRSILQMIKFPIFIAFLLGVLTIMVYNPVSSYLNTKSERLKNMYLKDEKEDLLAPVNGIWLKQDNLEDNGGEIIIKASKVYKELLIFQDVLLIYTDNNYNFLKRINAKMAKLNDNKTWTLSNCYLIQEGKNHEYVDKIIVPTNLTSGFISKTIKSDYDSIYNVSFWKLKSSIDDLQESGFDTLRFRNRFYYLLTLPFLFSVMIIVSAYFGIVSTRNDKKYLSIIKGIAVGFLIFISHNMITELVDAQKLTLFDGSIFIVIIFLAISIIMIMKKDLLNNFKFYEKNK